MKEHKSVCTATGAPETVRVDTELRSEGVTTSLADTYDKAVKIHSARFSQAASLTELATEYVFFTHAALFCYGKWPEEQDPLIHYIIETAGKSVPINVQLPTPVFKFLDVKDESGKVTSQHWNSTIAVCRKDEWPGLFSFMSKVAGVDRNKKRFVACTFQKIPIVDVLAMDRMTTLPSQIPYVDCYCLAVFTNKFTAKFGPEYRKTAWDPVPLVYGSPDPKVVRLSKAILAEQPIPMAGTVEPTYQEAEASLERDVTSYQADLPEGEILPEEKARQLSEEPECAER